MSQSFNMQRRQSMLRAATQSLFILLALIILCSVDPLVNMPDLGWHIRTGENILNTGALPGTAWFCFSIPDHVWVAHEWLQDILMYQLWHWQGIDAIRIWFALAGLLFLGLSLYILLRSTTTPLTISFLLIPGAALLVATRSLRLQFVSLIFFTCLACLLFSAYRNKRHSQLYFLPLIFLIWANVHGGFPVGFLLIGVFAAGLLGEVIKESRVNPNSSSNNPSRQFLATLIIASSLSLIATLVNPYGMELYSEVFQTLSEKYPQQIVVEWLPTSIASHTGEAFFTVAAALLATLLIKRPHISIPAMSSLIIFFFFGLSATRHSVFFIVLALPLLATWIEPLQRCLERELKFIAACSLCAGIIGYLLFAKLQSEHGLHGISQEDQLYPTRALEYLTGRESGRSIFHNVEWGGYMLLKNPLVKTFIDGRMTQWQVEGKSFLKTYAEIKEIKPGWKEQLDHFKIDMVLIKQTDPIAQALELLPTEWSRTYQDGQAVIFEKIQ